LDVQGGIPCQQFQIWVAAANSVSAARLMVDALRLSTLQKNGLFCRVDKARPLVSGTWHGGRAPHPPGFCKSYRGLVPMAPRDGVWRIERFGGLKRQ
jgi:hypothetical protein